MSSTSSELSFDDALEQLRQGTFNSAVCMALGFPFEIFLQYSQLPEKNEAKARAILLKRAKRNREQLKKN